MEESICTSPWSTTRPFVLLIPKASVASVLFNLFFANPQKGQGREKWQAKPRLLRALNSLADSVAGACVCVRKYHVSRQPPHPLCTVGLCNDGGRGVTICQEVCADSRGLYSGHYQCLDILLLIIIQVYLSQEEHTHTHTHPFNSESSLALCKLDREKEYDNKQPYVHSTRNNIWSFLCCLIFRPLLYFPRRRALWKCSCSRQELPRQYCNSAPPTPTPTHTSPPSRLSHRGVCLLERVKRAHPRACVFAPAVWRVLVQLKYKAWSMCWNAAPGMGSIILAYFTSRVPGLELARGPLSPNRWKWAEERRGGESERRRRRRRNRMDRGRRRGGDGREKESVCSH